MFTGIVEKQGQIVERLKNSQGLRLRISAGADFMEDVSLGDSIAVNGVCLTVSAKDQATFSADLMMATLRDTCFERLNLGDAVNLEKAMALTARFGGHIMTGHVDGLGQLVAKKRDGHATLLTFTADRQLLSGILHKGSIAINGVSLTAQQVDSGAFVVSLIPHTSHLTGLDRLSVGDSVHLETDVLGKYVKQFLNAQVKEEAKTCSNSAALTAFLMD